MSGNERGHSAVVEAGCTRQVAVFAAYLPSGFRAIEVVVGGSGHGELQLAAAEASEEQSRSPRAGVRRQADVRHRRRQGFPWPFIVFHPVPPSPPAAPPRAWTSTSSHVAVTRARRRGGAAAQREPVAGAARVHRRHPHYGALD